MATGPSNLFSERCAIEPTGLGSRSIPLSGRCAGAPPQRQKMSRKT